MAENGAESLLFSRAYVIIIPQATPRCNGEKNMNYPIVLIHGMLIKRSRPFSAFKKIKRRLETDGYRVYITNHDGVGTIESNAAQIKEEIEQILRETGCGKVNLIAHSKGGLDARYMISALDMSDKVASLVTLCTPHYGSKMSRKILTMPEIFVKIINFTFNTFYKIFGDKNPNLYAVGVQLKDDEMVKFNRTITDSPSVYYESYSSTLEGRKRNFVMGIPYIFSRYCEQEETDGIVSASAAVWGEYKGMVAPEPLSHNEVVICGPTSKKRRETVFSFYEEIAENLEKRGF